MNNSIKLIIILLIILFVFYLIYLSFQNRFSLSNLFKLEIKKKDGKNNFFNLFILDSLKPKSVQTTTFSSSVKNKNTEIQEKTTSVQTTINSKLKEEKTPEVKEIVPPLGFEKKDLSPFYQKISFTFNKSNSSNQSFISIVIYNKELTDVNITGWYFKTKKGLLFTIPKGIKYFKINNFIEYSDIVLEKDDRVEIYWGYNQTGIKNFNLRFNKCVGYLNNIYSFSPPLPKNCPPIELGDLSLLSGKCQNFLKNLPLCYQPTNKDINEFAFDSNCLKFFDKFNYLNCYEMHKKDSDFFQKIWRIYLRPDIEVFDFNLDKIHDRVMLFDQNNLLVNIVSF